MAGPQFANIQTFSRKGNKGGQSVAQVIAEATRDPEFSTHVDDPTPPRALFGDPEAFAEQHDAHIEARATVVKKKDGTKARRAIRKDRHTMASIVMSYPVPRAAIITDEDKARLKKWEDRNLEWLRKKYGDQLKVVLAHDDEEHPHLHAWLLADDPGADATMLHPGKVAKKRAEAEAKARGEEPRVAVKIGNGAYREAMKEWQQNYYEAVGAPEGLTRTGPERRRLSRKQWFDEKRAAEAAAATMARAADAEAQAFEVIEDAKSQAGEIVAGAEEKAERVTQKAAAVIAAVVALGDEFRDGTLSRHDGKVRAAHPERIKPGLPEVAPAMHAAADAAEAIRAERASLAAERVEIEEERGQIAQLADKLREALAKALRFARRPGTPIIEQVEAGKMKKEAVQLLRDVEKTSPPPEDPFEEPDGPGF
jgi:DTW domain-containing protein YfiP